MVFSLQAKLLFSDGEKVIPRLTHELPGIKVRVTVLGFWRGETDQTGGQMNSVAPGHSMYHPFVGPGPNSIMLEGILGLAQGGAGGYGPGALSSAIPRNVQPPGTGLPLSPFPFL